MSNDVLKFSGKVDKITGANVSFAPPGMVPRLAQLVNNTRVSSNKKLKYLKNFISFNLPCKVTNFICTMLFYNFRFNWLIVTFANYLIWCKPLLARLSY